MTNTLSMPVEQMPASATSYDAHVEQYRALAAISQQHGGLVVVWSEEHHGYVLKPVTSSE